MAEPEYLICMECESPVYTFEWRDGKVTEAQCGMCGNEDPSAFATEEDMEEMDAAIERSDEESEDER